MIFCICQKKALILQKIVDISLYKRIFIVMRQVIKKNLEVFRKAADELWVRTPKEDDDLIYEWIKEIHAWMAGYASESTYKKFVTEYGTQFVA